MKNLISLEFYTGEQSRRRKCTKKGDPGKSTSSEINGEILITSGSDCLINRFSSTLIIYFMFQETKQADKVAGYSGA